MAFIRGPNIVRNGLVLYLDAGNRKSCTGQPVTNLLTYTNTLTTDWSGYCGPTSNITYNTTDVTDPLGTNTAIKVVRGSNTVCNSTEAWGLLYSVYPSVILSSGKGYTVTVYARGASGGETIDFGLNDSHMTYSQTLTTTWTRYTYYISSVSDTSRGMQFRNTTGNCTYYIWGPQVVLGTVAGDYVASVGATNGTKNLTFRDLSGNNNNGTFTNAPVFSSSNLGVITFDGVDDYITVADNSTLDLSGDKTLCCWVNLGADPGGTGIVGKSSNSLAGMSIAYSWDSKGFQAIAWNSTNSPQLDKDLTRDINKWVYVVAVQSSTTRIIYALDSLGIRSATGGGGTHTWNNNLSFIVGGITDGYYVPSNTKIAGVSVYNRALSASEVLQNFNATKTRFGI